MTKRYFFLALTIMAFSGSFCFAQTGTIHPFANVPLCYPPSGVAMDKNGNYYYCDSGLFEMKKRNPAGVITVVSGNGTAGYTGDGGPATAASITVAQAIAIDPKGNLYFSCLNTHTIRKIDTSGIITTVAGTLSYGYTGDGGLADTATLGEPLGIATDEIGNVYFTDDFYQVIRKIDTSGIINTIAGISYSASGYDGFSGDGGPATNASFDGVFGIAIDKNQNIYVCDVNNYKLRKINAAGIISTVAGVDSGTFELTGMGGPADSANIQPPYYVVADTSGNILFTDQYLIYRISTAGIINVVGGEGSASDVGYTGPANLTHFGNVSGLAIGPDNNLYINDGSNGVVLRETIAPSTNPDTFYTYVDTSACSTITLYAVTTDTSATTLYTYFGDGTSDTTTFSPYFSDSSNRLAMVTHTYLTSGTFSLKEVMTSTTVAIDSSSSTYENLICHAFSINFYLDGNDNCMRDSGELSVNVPILTEVDSNGVAIDTISATSGFFYSAFGNPGDVYTFKVISYGSGIIPACSGGTITDTLNAVYPTATNNIGFICTGSTAFDLSEIATLNTGRHEALGSIIVNNSYCTPENAVVTMTFSPQYIFYSSTPAPASVSGNVVTWNLTDVSVTTGTQNIQFMLTVPGAWLIPGDTIHTSFAITPVIGDVDTSNNTSFIMDTVKASYDPNAISVTPSGYILPGTTLQYTINFENTGNDTAHNIAVLDTLPANVNVQSLRVDGASATMNTSVFNSGGLNIVKFDFPGINLLDSSHHNQCNGMVVFHIKTNSSTPDGTSLANHAGIFFDDNPVVMTDTVNNTISLVHGPANVCVGANATQVELATGGAWTLSNGYATGSAGVVTGVNAGVDILTYTLTTRYETLFTTKAITVDPLPAIYAVTGGGSLCAGATGVSIGLANSDTTAIYQPYIGTAPIGSAVTGTGSALDLGLETSAGIYTVMATSIAASCTSHMSGGAEVFVYPVVTPSVSIAASPAATVCSGSPISFIATEINGGTYPAFQWRVNGVNTATGSTYTYIPTFGDVVTTVLTSDALCTSVDTALTTMSITVDTTFTPTISLSSSRGTTIASGQTDTLTATIANAGTSPTSQWYINGTSIPGATTNTLIRTFTTPDSVSCIVTGEAPCGNSSAAYFNIHINTNESVAQISSTDDQIALIPNPNSGSFIIKGTWATNNERVSAEIIDMLGQVIYKNDFAPINGNINEQIQLSKNIPNGMYTLSLHSAGNSKVLHFVLAQ